MQGLLQSMKESESLRVLEENEISTDICGTYISEGRRLRSSNSVVSIMNADSDRTLFWGKTSSWSKVKLRVSSMLKVSGIVGWLGRVEGNL